MENIDFSQTIRDGIMFFIPFLFALCFHEFAHAWMAKRRGDRTAEMLGRLSLSPTVHADPIGTVALPILAMITHWPLFGWAKPVPVNPRNLKNPKQDMFWIALAGPMSNFLLAIVGAFGLFALMRFMPESLDQASGTPNVLLKMLYSFIGVNVLLAVFNLIPVHPLDGGKVLARFLPEQLNNRLEDAQPYMGYVLMIFFIAGGFRFLAGPIQFITSHILGFAGFMVG